MKIPARVMAISLPRPSSFMACPLIPSMEATRPFSPNAALKISPKYVSDETMTAEPADSTRNPSMVFIVPEMTAPTGFFCRTRPSSAINAMMMEACVKILLMIKFNTCIVFPHFLFPLVFKVLPVLLTPVQASPGFRFCLPDAPKIRSGS